MTAKNSGTGIVRAAVSDGQGRYNLADLAIGTYDVQVTKAGFQTVITKVMRNLTVGSLRIAYFQYQVGQSEQTIRV